MRSYPANNEVFELSILTPLTGLDLLRRFGYDLARWEFFGEEIVEPQTKRFKLLPVGYQPNLEAVRSAIVHNGGIIPCGQWCLSFKETFPEPDGKGPIGVANASWFSPYGANNFPYICANGETYFCSESSEFAGFLENWCWLSEVVD